MLWFASFTFSKEEDGQIMFTCTYFLLVVTFSRVLHLDVLRRQTELKLKVKTEISLHMAIMQNHPLPSLYTQYYRTV